MMGIIFTVSKISVYNVTVNVWHVQCRAKTVWLVIEVVNIII
jgi:hypothetical protein